MKFPDIKIIVNYNPSKKSDTSHGIITILILSFLGILLGIIISFIGIGINIEIIIDLGYWIGVISGFIFFLMITVILIGFLTRK